MSHHDPSQLQRRRRRRRRRSLTGAGLIAAALSAMLYTFTGRQDLKRNDRNANAPTASSTASSASDHNFDFYLVALSLAPAFCEDGHQSKRECRALTAASFQNTPLTLHGLWPERRDPGRYPRGCAGPELSLRATVRSRMTTLMPGIADSLDEHEWRVHGTCSGLDADAYFNAALDWVEQANRAFGPTITAAAGRQLSAAELRAAANALRPGLGDAAVFICRNLRTSDQGKRGRPYLQELRMCVDNDGPKGEPRTPLACAAVERRDQGCGSRFWIDDVT